MSKRIQTLMTALLVITALTVAAGFFSPVFAEQRFGAPAFLVGLVGILQGVKCCWTEIGRERCSQNNKSAKRDFSSCFHGIIFIILGLVLALFCSRSWYRIFRTIFCD